VDVLRDHEGGERIGVVAAALGISPATVNRSVSNETGGDGEDAQNGIADDAGVSFETPDKSDPPHHHLARNCGNNEWYTPAEDVERARKVLGGIDLDPASSDLASAYVDGQR
jgi:hypothetical protein